MSIKNPVGRPRVTSFTTEEMIALGEEMLEWIKKNNPIHLSMWYTVEKGFIYKEWKAFLQIPEFLPYYEQALRLVGTQYLRKDSDVEPSLKQRWQRVYFKDVKDQEDEDLQEKLNKELEQKKAIIDHEKAKSDVPPLSDKVDQENIEMSENYKLRKEIEELKAKLENKSETRSELC